LFVDGLGWVGFDPSNRVSPDEHYVRVACGRDYRDAAPIRGLRRGGADETLAVDVRITQSAQTTQ
jgi:transglutaminase-like putative cysteine protease